VLNIIINSEYEKQNATVSVAHSTETSTKLAETTCNSQTQDAEYLFTQNAKNLKKENAKHLLSKFFESNCEHLQKVSPPVNKLAVMTCISQTENVKNLQSKFIDPILDEMLLIKFQPFYDFIFSGVKNSMESEIGTQAKDKAICYKLHFTDWDKLLFNTLHNKRSLGHV